MENANNQYLPIIGLEIHVQLNTNTKMFCGCSADVFGAQPNTHTCPVCLGLPGALPVPNKKAIEKTILLAQALGCEINLKGHFDRKNYFYPDLPKGFQITQYEAPIGLNGQSEIQNSKFDPAIQRVAASNDSGEIRNSVRIRRVHLEEDTGTLKHQGEVSLINFNRSGIPLAEIVTEPDLHSAADAKAFLKNLRRLVRWIGVSDADMERGSLRIEPSVSILKIPNPKSQFSNDQISNMIQEHGYPGYRVELKNINSFRYAKRAIEREVERLTKMLEKGETPKQETRGYDEKRDETFEQRVKEEEADYRYFPEPDVPPLSFTKDYIDSIRQTLPQLPEEALKFSIFNFQFSVDLARQITREREVWEYFRSLIDLQMEPEQAANLVINQPEVMEKVPGELIKELEKEKAEVIDSTDELEPIVQKIIDQNPDAVEDYQTSDENAINFLIGQVMKETQGKADASVARRLISDSIAAADAFAPE